MTLLVSLDSGPLFLSLSYIIFEVSPTSIPHPSAKWEVHATSFPCESPPFESHCASGAEPAGGSTWAPVREGQEEDLRQDWHGGFSVGCFTGIHPFQR